MLGTETKLQHSLDSPRSYLMSFLIFKLRKQVAPLCSLALVFAFINLGCNMVKQEEQIKLAPIIAKNKWQDILGGDQRSEQNKVRDVYRNPKRTLEFFGIKPGMTVVEISPGQGWYTEILGPYLKEEGTLYLSRFSEDSDREYYQNANKALFEKMSAHKDKYGKIEYTTFEPPKMMGPVAPANSADLLLTFRNVHNWMKVGKEKQAFKEFFSALKPGGILGLVEHREKLTKIQDPKAKSGYVREDFIIELAQSVGFEFISKSEINANYLDVANYPEGVWSLPPALRLKENNRAYYLSIGESDRMTLKFRKPIQL